MAQTTSIGSDSAAASLEVKVGFVALILGILSILLCASPIGLLFGVGFIIWFASRNKQEKQNRFPKTLLATGVVGLLSLCVLVSCDTSSTFSFSVDADSTIPSDTEIIVRVEGASGGKTISDKYVAKPGEEYKLDYRSGSYTFTVDTKSLAHNDYLYKAESKEVEYKGTSDTKVSLSVVLDENAMKKAAEQKTKQQEEARQQAEEKARLEAEAAAAAEAEVQEKARQEEEARQQAEEKARLEAEAAAAAAASATAGTAAQGKTDASASSSNQAPMSYIANTNTGVFHNVGCSSVKRMKESNKWYYEGTRQSLIDRGYRPCKRCNP